MHTLQGMPPTGGTDRVSPRGIPLPRTFWRDQWHLGVYPVSPTAPYLIYWPSDIRMVSTKAYHYPPLATGRQGSISYSQLLDPPASGLLYGVSQSLSLPSTGLEHHCSVSYSQLLDPPAYRHPCGVPHPINTLHRCLGIP